MKKNFKRLIKKVNVVGLLYLGLLTAFTVGFSSWAIIHDSKINSNVNAQFGEVKNISDYIKPLTFKTFDICEHGLVVDETIVYKANIEISTVLTIKDGILTANKSITNSFKLDVNVVNKGTFNFLNAVYLGSQTPSVSYGFNETSFIKDKQVVSNLNADSLKSTFVCDTPNLTNITTLNFVMSFEINFVNNQADFKTTIYDQLGNNPLGFDVNMGVRA